MKNAIRFWTGISIFAIEVFVLVVFLLSFIDWSWITEELVWGILITSTVILINALATYFVLDGSEEKVEKEYY